MRSFSLLLLVLGAVASEPLFHSGKEYEFDYHGKIVNGIPQLNSQYAGLTIQAKVILQAKGSQTYKLAVKNVRSTKFNEKFTGPESQGWENWRQLRTPEGQQIPSELSSMLEQPIEFSMVNGEVRHVQVSEHEPEWSVNFKKSLVSLIKVHTPSGQDLSINSIRSTSSGELPSTWKVMEQGIDGECENTYEVMELPEYMLQEVAPVLLEENEKCQGGKFVQIIKTRDVNKCVERTAFQITEPVRTTCPTGNCGQMWQRSSLTRYIACGERGQNLEVKAILNQGELQQSLLSFDTENVVTGTMQTLIVREIKSSMTSLPQIQSPRTVEDLFYEYPIMGHKKPRNSMERKEMLQNLPLTADRVKDTIISDSESIIAKMSPNTLKHKIVEKITKIVRDLKEEQGLEKEYIAHEVLTVTKLFSLLSTQQMKSLYHEVKSVFSTEGEKEIAEQLIIEVGIMSGTNPAVMFVKEMIESEEMSPLRIGTAIITLPHYVKTPTVKVLDELFELIKSPAITRHHTLKSNAQLAFATLVNRACISGNRETRFPVFVYGEFCNSQISEIVGKYIPYLHEELQSAQTEGEKISAIFALGSLGHKSVVSILLPYIEGKTSMSSPLLQRVALYSLGDVMYEHREILLPVFSALVHNPSEERTVRMAALSMMLYLQPSMVNFQKLATSTWFERDHEFQKFVYSTLKSLSEVEVEEQPSFKTPLYHNSVKARMVLHLAKPMTGFFSSALNHFTATWLRELQVGYHMHGRFNIGGHQKEMYGKLEYFLEQIQFSPIEFVAYTQGTGKLMEKIQQVFGSEINIHPEWRNIISKLNLELKNDESSIHTGVWTRLFSNIPVIAGLGERNVETMLHSVKRYISEPHTLKQKVCGKTPFQLVKTNNWAPSELLVPSDLGLPIVFEYNMPNVLAMKGEVEIECSGSKPSVSLDLATKMASSVSGFVGTICPFTKELVAVGIEKQTTVNYPVKVVAELEGETLKVKLEEPQAIRSSSEPVELISNTIKPFTVVKPAVYIDGVSMVNHHNTKTIHSDSEMMTKTFKVLETLGFDVEIVVKTEQEWLDMKSNLDHLSWYNYNPLNAILFGWTNTALAPNGKPSVRQFSTKVVYNPRSSTTKEIEAEIELALGHQGYNQIPKVLSLSAQGQNQLQAQKVQQLLQSLDIGSGLGLTGKVIINLKGGSPKTYRYTVSAGHGNKGIEQKWKLHLENQEAMSICVDGGMTLPLVPLREIENLRFEDIHVSFKNTIGFGRTCNEHTIKVYGSSSISEQQQQRVQRSESSRKCEEAKHEVHQLKSELENARFGSVEYKRIEHRLLKSIEEEHEYCRQQLIQSTTLDGVKFTVEYSPMPEYVKMWAKMVDSGVKAALVPYMSEYEGMGTRGEIKVDLKFVPEWNTVNMVLSTETGTIKYRNIRLPEQIREWVPVRPTHYPHEYIFTSHKGNSVYPECRIGNHVVSTFSKKSYSYVLDDCYHVLSADGSQHKSFSVLAKEHQGKKFVKAYILGSKIELEPTHQQENIEVEIDEQKIHLNKNERREVVSQNKMVTYRIHRTSDNWVVAETPYIRISTNGETVEIEHTRLISESQLHGLCGTSHGQHDVLTAQSCIGKSIQSAALTYRVKDQSCSDYSSQQRVMQSQKPVCGQKMIQKTPITKIVQQQLKKCSQMKHAMIKQTGRLCISQVPIVECGSGCAAKSVVRKNIPFTCIPSDRKRVIQLYEEKVMRGDILPELRNMEETFTSEMHVPVSCTHPAL